MTPVPFSGEGHCGELTQLRQLMFLKKKKNSFRTTSWLVLLPPHQVLKSVHMQKLHDFFINSSGSVLPQASHIFVNICVKKPKKEYCTEIIFISIYITLLFWIKGVCLSVVSLEIYRASGQSLKASCPSLSMTLFWISHMRLIKYLSIGIFIGINEVHVYWKALSMHSYWWIHFSFF